MTFTQVEDRKVKIRSVDQKHPVKRTKRPQPVKAKKTRLSAGPGRQKIKVWLGDNEQFEIRGYSGKFKVYDRRWMYGADEMPDDPKLIGGAVTFEQAVEIAEEEAGRV
jgi:hypothetical protein